MPSAKEILLTAAQCTVSATASYAIDAAAGEALRGVFFRAAAAVIPGAAVPLAAIGAAGAISAVASTAAAALFGRPAPQTVASSETARKVTEHDDGWLEVEDEKKPGANK